MTLDELKIKAERDTKIDASEMDIKSLQIPYLTSDWLKTLNIEILTLKKMDTEHNQLKGRKFHYFKTEYNVVIKSSSDVWEYIRADQDFVDSLHRLTYQEEKVKFVEGVIDILNKMSFNISNAIKWQMFKSGG